MIDIRPQTTRMLVGRGALESAVTAAARNTSPLALVDARVDAISGGALSSRVMAAAGGGRLLLVDPDAGVDGEAREAVTAARAVIAVGGGTLLDRVKLWSVPDADVTPARPVRAGLVRLSTIARAAVTRVLVPTTLGTAAEVSSAACRSDADGAKRLVCGDVLRPEVAVLDPTVTRTLPRRLALGGVLEVVARVLGAYVAGPLDPVEDALGLSLLAQLGEAGRELAEGAHDAPDADSLRLTIARLSAYSHLGWVLTARRSFGWKLWYVANELSVGLGVRKMEAVACLIPTYWSAILAGEERLGSGTRLRCAWRAVASGAGVDEDPPGGVRELMAMWDCTAELTATEQAVRTVADNVELRWGRGLPMLRPLKAADVRALIGQALIPNKEAAA
jgi:NADP-dependent alcohol dehydrogenase